jgi:hypothetical protein
MPKAGGQYLSTLLGTFGVALRDNPVHPQRGAGEGAEQQNVMRFRVARMTPADDVPHLTDASPSPRGQILLVIADVDGPVTNRNYQPEEIAPHRDAIESAIASGRVYTVEMDSTESNWPHNPDPRGPAAQRILRAIAEQRGEDDDATRPQ